KFFPLLFCVCFLFRLDLIYVVVGGWLHDFLKGRSFYQILLKRIKAIYPQSDDLTSMLRTSYSLSIVFTLHNFRIHSFTPGTITKDQKFKIVFMARINRMKGVDSIFKLADKVVNLGFQNNFTIDFFGPI